MPSEPYLPSSRAAVVTPRPLRPAGAPRVWARDEAAIDFPSMAASLEAITSAFLPHGDIPTETATLRLTARQAFEGASLPLEVPVRCTCRGCGGRGEQWPDPCATCAGSGIEIRPQQVRVLVPARVRDGQRFRFTVTPRHHPDTRIELRVQVDQARGRS